MKHTDTKMNAQISDTTTGITYDEVPNSDHGVFPDDIRCPSQFDCVDLFLDDNFLTGFQYSYDSPIYFVNQKKHTKDQEFAAVGYAKNIDNSDMEQKKGQKKGNFDFSQLSRLRQVVENHFRCL